MPDKLLENNDSTAVRPEDVLFLENHVASGGSATSIHSPIEAETWVEHNYDTALLRSMRSAGLGGPMATMLSTDTPALAIFGSALDIYVLDLAKTLSDLSMLPVMIHPVADDPLVKFEETRNMTPETDLSMAEDWSDTDSEEDIVNESEDEHNSPGDSDSRTLRLRGGTLHHHGNINVVEDPDHITPAGIARPDGSHRSRVRLHLRLRENMLYNVSICSKNAFKFQTEMAEHLHELTEPITRPQLLSCIDLKVEARPSEVILDRSYSNLGFVVHRAESIAGREYLPRGFDPPLVKATRNKQGKNQTTASMTVGIESMQPTFITSASRSRTAAETLQLADEKPVPMCRVTEQIGKEWEEVDKSFSSYDVAWEPMTSKNKVSYPVNIRFGMGLEFSGKEERNINKLPSISHILRNQIIIWVFDPELKAKVRGMIVLTTTYIADVKITEPLTIPDMPFAPDHHLRFVKNWRTRLEPT
ncbi:hypothetical protein C8J57DRAFT_182086 [Mycena rebaudengoi]|nr:hypothetical protein C8J57DRAFT_182086 [Mycena rebaudengoi]